MKPRRILITMEVETNAPLKTLTDAMNWHFNLWHNDTFKVLQIQAKVKEEKP